MRAPGGSLLQWAVSAFREQARGSNGLAALNACFRTAAATFGFTAHAAGQISPFDPENPFVLLNWPKTWLDLYAAKGFAAQDVAVRESLHSPEPFTWTEIKARHPGASTEIFAAAERFGWSEGFVVPVYGPGPLRALVSLAGAEPPLTGERRAAMELIALSAYERARELREGENPGSKPITKREQEVLTLIASGKSDGEIASALGISRTTAHFHAENSRRKLGAATRAHAVALAIGRGLVTP